MFTNVPYGISSMGFPLAGPAFRGVKAASTVYFVDGLAGADGNGGLSPDTALATIGAAITKANAYDVIYVLSKGFSGTDPYAYQEAATDLSIAYAQNNLAIIGCPTSMCNPFEIQLKSYSTTPVLTINAAMCAVENLSFNRGSSTTGGIKLYDEGDTTNLAMGASIYNCHFKNLRGSAAAATSNGGGIYIYGGWNYTIQNCFFDDCRVGIFITSSAASTVKWLRIDGCRFDGTTTNRDVDIYMLSSAVTYANRIENCSFGGQPAYAGTGYTALFVRLEDDGVLSNCCFGAASTGTYGAAGNAAIIPTTWLMTGCYEEGGLISRT